MNNLKYYKNKEIEIPEYLRKKLYMKIELIEENGEKQLCYLATPPNFIPLNFVLNFPDKKIKARKYS